MVKFLISLLAMNMLTSVVPINKMQNANNYSYSASSVENRFSYILSTYAIQDMLITDVSYTPEIFDQYSSRVYGYNLTSSDENIAVGYGERIVARNSGTVEITVSKEEDELGNYIPCKFTLNVNLGSPSSIIIEGPNRLNAQNGQAQFKATSYPLDTSNQEIEWSATTVRSYDYGFFEIDQNGVLKTYFEPEENSLIIVKAISKVNKNIYGEYPVFCLADTTSEPSSITIDSHYGKPKTVYSYPKDNEISFIGYGINISFGDEHSISLPLSEASRLENSQFEIINGPKTVSDITKDRTGDFEYDGKWTIAYKNNHDISVDLSLKLTFKYEPPFQPQSISVKTLPTKTEYLLGEDFDPSGIEVNVHYEHDATFPVPFEDLEFSGYRKYTAGQQGISVRDKKSNLITHFYINVMPRDVEYEIYYELVKDLSEISFGDYITFVNEDMTYAIGDLENKVLKRIPINTTNNIFNDTEGVVSLKVEESEYEGNYYFVNSELGYLYAPGTIRDEIGYRREGPNDAASFSISIDKESYNSLITTRKSYARNKIGYDESLNGFACFETTKNIKIFKKHKILVSERTPLLINARYVNEGRTYYMGESVKKSDFEVTVLYDTNEKEVVNDFEILNPVLTEEKSTINICYKEKSIEVTSSCIVNCDNRNGEVKSIRVYDYSYAKKTYHYYPNEELEWDLTGLYLSIRYEHFDNDYLNLSEQVALGNAILSPAHPEPGVTSLKVKAKFLDSDWFESELEGFEVISCDATSIEWNPNFKSTDLKIWEGDTFSFARCGTIVEHFSDNTTKDRTLDDFDIYLMSGRGDTAQKVKKIELSDNEYVTEVKDSGLWIALFSKANPEVHTEYKTNIELLVVKKLNNIYPERWYEESQLSNRNFEAQAAVIEFSDYLNDVMSSEDVCLASKINPNNIRNAWKLVKEKYDSLFGESTSLSNDDLIYAQKMMKYASAAWGSSADTLQRAMKTYEHVVSQYGCEAFLSNPRASNGNLTFINNSNLAVNSSLILVTSLILLTSLFILKRKKHDND